MQDIEEEQEEEEEEAEERRGGLAEPREEGEDAEERECDRVVTEGESGALCVSGWRVCVRE